MKLSICLIIAVMLLASGCQAAPNDSGQGKANLYGQQIYLPATASPKLKQTAEALKGWLGKMTGVDFAITDQPGKQAVYLVTDTSAILPPTELKTLRAQESNEAFQIVGDAGKLWIVGKSDQAIEHGVYWYLDKLGCRWLIPSEKWTIIPHRDSIIFDQWEIVKRVHNPSGPDTLTMKLNYVQAPAFAMRDFAGTGGFGRPAIDPKQRMGEAWYLYQRQNLFGGVVRLGGHAGEAFVLKYKDVWAQHPEYLAEVNGQRQVYSPNEIIKLCISNPGLQALWIKDRIDALKADPNALSISVEPSDGGNDCECAECKKLGSVSDRVFYLANLTARAVSKELPGKYVNLYAYNTHAAPPSIAVEPNVIVSIVPYGFQRTGLTPEEFIEAWGKKCSALAMYDYWGIPDWSHNLPDMSTSTVASKIRFWRDHQVKYFNAESTYCGGSMGLNWYLGSRLLWNPAQDEKAIIDDYFNQAFGPAQAPIRAMYSRWGDDFILSDHELALCFRDIHQALGLTNDPAITARLVDLARYAHFMRLWYEYLNAPPKSPERLAAARAYVNYIWRIYETNMVQVFRVAQLIDRDERPTLKDIDMDNPMWKDIPQLPDADILRLLDDGIAKYQPLDFQARHYSTKLKPLAAATSLSDKYIETNGFGFSADFKFAVPENTSRVRLKIILGVVSGNGKTDRIKVTDATGKLVYEKTIANTPEWQDLFIPTAAPGVYSLSIIDQKNTFRLQIPANLPFVCTNALTSIDLSPTIYFYVPTGLKKVAVYSEGVLPLKLFDADGKPVKVERNEQKKNVFVIDVPAGQDGRCWSFGGFKAWEPLRLLNCPNVFAYSPAGMMAPVEILSQR